MASDMLTEKEAGWVQFGIYAVKDVSEEFVRVRIDDGPYKGVRLGLTGDDAAVVARDIDGNPSYVEGDIHNIVEMNEEKLKRSVVRHDI